MSKEKTENLLYRKKAPTFPMGFRFGSAKDICIIDFIDVPGDNKKKVSYSIAITKNLAQDLIENLERFVHEE